MPEDYHSLDSFMEHCELITCGDDSVLTCSDLAYQLFTPEKVFEIFSKMGWKPKFGLEGWQPIYKLNYCSQNFKWMGGYVVPVPNNYEKLLASLLYAGDNRGVRETLTRVLGVKIESYFLTGFRSHLDVLISFLFEKYYFLLRGKPLEDELTYAQLLVLNRDFAAAYGLYLSEHDQRIPHVPNGPVEEFSNSHVRDC
jgi:hypothetical protein